MDDLPHIGTRVRLSGGKHRGKNGEVLRYMPAMVEIKLQDGSSVKVKHANIEPVETISCKPSSGNLGGPLRTSKEISTTSSNKTDLLDSSLERAYSFSSQASDVSSAPESDDRSDIASVTTSKSVGALKLAASAVSAVGSVAQTTFGGLAWGGRAVAHVVLGGRKEPTSFLKWFFGEDLVEIRPKDGVENALVEPDFEGRTYELAASRVDSEGKSFWGGSNDITRLLYVLKRPHQDSLQARLEGVAAFMELRDPCKVASRLELLTSSAPPEKEFEMLIADFEMISEPQPSSDSGGCGFIPEAMLIRLFGKGIKGRRTTSVQVRVVSPALGIFKGVLTKKPGISKIQLTPSMRKVRPSMSNDVNNVEWAWMLVTRDFPSSSNLQIGKWIRTGQLPCKSFRQPKLSKMLQRLMKTLGVPGDVVSTYAKQDLRKEAWVVGAADPTFPKNVVPAGHIYVNGLSAEHVPVLSGQPMVFVTRSPCTLPEDGHLLPLMTSKASNMSDEDWQAFNERHFGEVLFSNKGNAIPEAISEGDLDGDLYFVCWDDSVVRNVEPVSIIKVPNKCSSKEPAKREPLGSTWLMEARSYMLNGEAGELKQMIGKLYCAGERIADKSPKGLNDPDARAYFKAYSQAIDAGKHGNSIDLPEHLREAVGMRSSIVSS